MNKLCQLPHLDTPLASRKKNHFHSCFWNCPDGLLLISNHLCHLLSAPSDARSVRVVTNGTHLRISWSEPASPNGVVTYNIVLMERDRLTSDVITITSETMVTEFKLVVNYAVKPYSEYTVSVVSQTSAGMGDPVMSSFQTPEGGK